MERVPKAPQKNRIKQISSAMPVRQSERCVCNSQKTLKNWRHLKGISKAKANRNQAVRAQPAERSFNQQLVPYQANFVEEHQKEARKCKASLDYLWLAYMSKGTQPAKNAEQSNETQAVNGSESNNNFPMHNPVAQAVQNGATASGQETENVSKTSRVLTLTLRENLFQVNEREIVNESK